MTVKKNTLSDDFVDLLLADSDELSNFGMGGMRGSLKRVLTERALNEKLSRQLSEGNSSWNLFASWSKPVLTAQGANLLSQQSEN